MGKRIKDTMENWANMVYPCDDCIFNGGQYCNNDKYANNYNNCLDCEAWEQD